MPDAGSGAAVAAWTGAMSALRHAERQQRLLDVAGSLNVHVARVQDRVGHLAPHGRVGQTRHLRLLAGRHAVDDVLVLQAARPRRWSSHRHRRLPLGDLCQVRRDAVAAAEGGHRHRVPVAHQAGAQHAVVVLREVLVVEHVGRPRVERRRPGSAAPHLRCAQHLQCPLERLDVQLLLVGPAHLLADQQQAARLRIPVTHAEVARRLRFRLLVVLEDVPAEQHVATLVVAGDDARLGRADDAEGDDGAAVVDAADDARGGSRPRRSARRRGAPSPRAGGPPPSPSSAPSRRAASRIRPSGTPVASAPASRTPCRGCRCCRRPTPSPPTACGTPRRRCTSGSRTAPARRGIPAPRSARCRTA